MLNTFLFRIKDLFLNVDNKIIKLIKIGLKISLFILLIGFIFLTTYLFWVHNYILFKIGILIFELSLYFAADFIVSGIAVDSIKKQLI